MRMAKMLVMLVCVLGIVASVQAMMARDALIGKWKATVTPDDGGKETTDNITFKGGKFSSENEKADGYEDATYEDDPSPQGISAKFSVTLKNKAGDTATWTGFSTGTEMDGTLVVTKKDGGKTSYAFKASKG